MENIENNSNIFNLSVEPVTKTELVSIARWARFLALLGMIILVIGVVVAVMGTFIMTDFTGVEMGGRDEALRSTLRVGMVVFSFILSIVAFFPLYYLLIFSNKMSKAIRTNSQELLNHSFLNLKRHFRFLGIVAIIVFVIYGLSLLFTILGIIQ